MGTPSACDFCFGALFTIFHWNAFAFFRLDCLTVVLDIHRDLHTEDEDGRAWDPNYLEMRNRAMRKVLQDKFQLFIESPMCTAYSIMNNINYPRMSNGRR